MGGVVCLLPRVTTCQKYGYYKLLIALDYQVVVSIIKKEVHVPWKVMAITSHIHAILEDFDVEIQHVWREVNQVVDLITSMILGNEERVLYPNEFPSSLRDIISRDANLCTYTCI